MPDEPRASELRQEIARLTTERAAVERELMRRRRMLAASLVEVRPAVDAWRAFRAALRRWRGLSERIETLWRSLGEAQAQSPEELTP